MRDRNSALHEDRALIQVLSILAECTRGRVTGDSEVGVIWITAEEELRTNRSRR